MADSLPTTSVQDRLQRLQELTEFTETCKKRLDDVFETLGWSWDYNKEMMEQCPFDPDHRVPARSMDRHKASCSLRKMGYSAEEQAEMFDPSVCYENSSVRSFTMDKSTQHQVILQARSAAPLMRMEGVFASEDEADRPPVKSALKQKESGGGASSAPTAQKPSRFQCPADFVSFCHKPCSSTLTESLKSNKNELWLIKAPASFNPECFSGIKVPLSGLQTLKVPAAAGGVKTGSGQQIYSVLASTHVTSELCLLTSDKESSSGVVFGPAFSGLLNVCESYGDSSANQAPQVIPADPAPSIPPGLKQRFHPFGSKTPTLTCVAETQTDGAAFGPSSATPRSLPGKRLIGETKQEDEDEEEEEGRKKKKKKKKEKRIKTEQEEESTVEVRVKEEPVTEIQDQAMVEEGGVLEEKRKKKRKKKDREREEVEEGVENCVKVEEVTVKCEPTDTLQGDVAEDSAKKKKKKKKKSKTDDD